MGKPCRACPRELSSPCPRRVAALFQPIRTAGRATHRFHPATWFIKDQRSVTADLPERDFQILWVRYGLCLPPREAAELLGCRPDSVRKLCRRALERVRRRLPQPPAAAPARPAPANPAPLHPAAASPVPASPPTTPGDRP